MKRRLPFFILLIAMAGIVAWFALSSKARPNNQTAAKSSPISKTAATQSTTTPATGFDKQRYSLQDPTSIWVVVNKGRPLQPQTYAPTDLTPTAIGGQVRTVTAQAIDELAAAAKQAGLPVKVISGYRSYQMQQEVYGGYVSKSSQADADTYSARPGYSEHQTGLAADLGNQNGSCDLDICFGNTALGQWLAANAYKYGLIIRYPQTKTSITGYQYEPWHVRYVGKDLAAQLQQNNQTMEEFFGLPPAPVYQ